MLSSRRIVRDGAVVSHGRIVRDVAPLPHRYGRAPAKSSLPAKSSALAKSSASDTDSLPLRHCASMGWISPGAREIVRIDKSVRMTEDRASRDQLQQILQQLLLQ